jgi:hypothetical protein
MMRVSLWIGWSLKVAYILVRNSDVISLREGFFLLSLGFGKLLMSQWLETAKLVVNDAYLSELIEVSTEKGPYFRHRLKQDKVSNWRGLHKLTYLVRNCELDAQ